MSINIQTLAPLPSRYNRESMHAARIAELLQPFLGLSNNGSANNGPLTPNILEQISTYIDILLRWNARVNLTAICDPEEIVTRHFGESLFAARHLFPKANPVSSSVSPEPPVVEALDSAGARVADLGSGAGFPGLPIKLWAPDIALTLIESNHKKAAFLREVTRTLTLTNVNIQNVRAETIAPASFDVVILRAVERFAIILPVAASLVAAGGRLALLLSSSQLAMAHSTLRTVIWNSPISIPHSQSRQLLIGTKDRIS